MKEYAVVTFIFNGYDLLRDPLVIDDDVDYYCLTDNPNLKSDIWNCVYIKKVDTFYLTSRQKTNVVKNSFYKFIPNHYKYYICIDASLKIIGKISEVLNYYKYNEYDLGLAIHPDRMRYMDEYVVWRDTRSGDPKYIEIFKDYCKKNGVDYYEETGLIECTVKIYKNCDKVLNYIDEIYDTLKEYGNFGDFNDQCYITNIFRKHENEFNTCFFYRQFFSNSKYLNSYIHGTNRRWINKFTIKTTNNKLFGKYRELLEI